MIKDGARIVANYLNVSVGHACSTPARHLPLGCKAAPCTEVPLLVSKSGCCKDVEVRVRKNLRRRNRLGMVVKNRCNTSG